MDYNAAMELTSELMLVEFTHRITVCLFEVSLIIVFADFVFIMMINTGCQNEHLCIHVHDRIRGIVH